MDRELRIALQEIKQRITRVDPMLVRLINFAVKGSAQVQYGLALRMGSATVFGIPASSTTTGEVLDRETLTFAQALHAVDVAAGKGDGHWPNIENQLRELAMFTKEAQSDDDSYGKFIDYLASSETQSTGSDVASFPDEMTDDAISASTPPKALTLTNVVMVKDSGGTDELDNIRINLSSIDAWWTFELGVPEGAGKAFARIRQSGAESSVG